MRSNHHVASVGDSNICIDVAARDLKMDNINYDYQQQDYMHRVGRTEWSNTTGEAYTFFTSNECKIPKALVSILEEAKQEVPQNCSCVISCH